MWSSRALKHGHGGVLSCVTYGICVRSAFYSPDSLVFLAVQFFFLRWSLVRVLTIFLMFPCAFSNLLDGAPFPARYLRPALEDDALLLSLEELLLKGDNDNGNDDDDDDDELPTVAVAAAAAAGVEEGKGSVVDPTAAAAPQTQKTGPASAEARIAELDEENARLKEALQAVDARMARANRVLRSLAGGGAEGGDGSGGEGEDDGEGSVAGVRGGLLSIL